MSLELTIFSLQTRRFTRLASAPNCQSFLTVILIKHRSFVKWLHGVFVFRTGLEPVISSVKLKRLNQFVQRNIRDTGENQTHNTRFCRPVTSSSVSVSFARFEGFEPSTTGFGSQYHFQHGPKRIFKWIMEELNFRPMHYECIALPLS